MLKANRAVYRALGTLAWIVVATVASNLTTNRVFASDAVLIEFSSQRCKFCGDMKPVVRTLESEGVAVRHVDVDQEPEMAVRFNISQLPTYVVFSGGKEATRLVGLQETATMRTAIQSASKPQLRQTNAQSRPAPTTNTLNAAQTPQTRLAPVNNGLPVGYGGAAVSTEAEPMPTIDLARAVARAEAATVRLRVFEEVGYGVGTGTVIDSHGDELLILTCGHLFRDNQGKTKIEVDLFYAGQVNTVEGRVLDFDAGDRDIGLVTVRTDLPIQPVPVLRSSRQLQNGASVFSFGCDRGANPSRRDTRITGLNLYNQHLKLSNVEIAGAPIDGRSGGGLFDSQGNLIGVCNAADYDDDIGIYAGPGEVYWQLTRVRLQNLFDSGSPQPGLDELRGQPQTNGLIAQASYDSPAPTAAPTAANATFANDAEVIVIVRNRSRPQDQATIRVFDTPPPGLLEMLR